MTFKELCAERYSCRSYKRQSVETEKLEYIKECVRLAPSAVNRQPWCFLLIDDEERLEKVKACYARPWINEVPVIAICCVNREEAWTRQCDGHNHGDVDIAIATEHLCLAATEQGLGNCWVCNFDVEKLCQSGIIPAGFEPAVLVPIGYAADLRPEKKRKSIEDIWN